MRKPSPALVIACLALFMALGGTGYAATQLPSSKGQATASSAGKRGPRGFRGRRGPRGPQGLQGVPGPAGNDAFGTLVYRAGAAVEIANGEQGFVTAQCEAGFHATGGGVIASAEVPGEEVNSSYPSKASGEPSNTGWSAFVDNETGNPQTAQAYAICAKAGTVVGP